MASSEFPFNVVSVENSLTEVPLLRLTLTPSSICKPTFPVESDKVKPSIP